MSNDVTRITKSTSEKHLSDLDSAVEDMVRAHKELRDFCDPTLKAAFSFYADGDVPDTVRLNRVSSNMEVEVEAFREMALNLRDRVRVAMVNSIERYKNVSSL